MNFLEISELKSLLSHARQHSTRDWLLFLMAYRHGLRASEVVQLKLDQIKSGSLDIQRLKGSRHTIQALAGHKGQPLLDEIKGLKLWLAERPRDSGDFLFPSGKGGALSRVQVFRLFRHYAQLANLPTNKQHPHLLKHSIASHLVRAGLGIAHVQIFLGHASLSSTQQYVHLSESEVSDKARDVLMTVF